LIIFKLKIIFSITIIIIIKIQHKVVLDLSQVMKFKIDIGNGMPMIVIPVFTNQQLAKIKLSKIYR